MYFSKEHRKKLSEAAKRRKHSEETKRKISESLKGRPFSEERIDEMRGRVVSEETRQKISDANLRNGTKPSELAHERSRASRSRVAEEQGSLKYSAVHKWLYNRHGRPKICEQCGNPATDYAKKRGRPYSRNRNDYWTACRSCHMKYDLGAVAQG